MAELERSTAAAPAVHSQADIESLPALVGRLGDNMMALLDAKLKLLKKEVTDDAMAYVRSAAMIAVGGVVALVGLALVNVALALFVSKLFSFSQPVNYALGFLIMGALYLAIGGVLVITMKNRMAARNPVPEKTVEELRKDQQWLKNEM
ncbi:MAG: phage holin family protein [Pyrinomonadaceae bacterium]|nr:phage holin family protein [Pyrinomonadaceae bacterium]